MHQEQFFKLNAAFRLGTCFLLAWQLLLLSCSEIRPANDRHKSEASLDGKKTEAEIRSSEPVMVAGGFLMCAQYSVNESARVGCRIEDQLRNKIPLANLSSADLSIIQTSDGQIVAGMSFIVEDVASFWHWSIDVLNFDDRQVRLERNFGFPIEPDRVVVLDRYPYEASETVEEVCQGTIFGGSCFYLSAAGASCESTCTSHGGIAPAAFSIFEANMCSNLLDIIARDPYPQQQARPLAYNFNACGFSVEALTENIPSGRYVMDAVNEDQPREALPSSLVQVCNCVK